MKLFRLIETPQEVLKETLKETPQEVHKETLQT